MKNGRNPPLAALSTDKMENNYKANGNYCHTGFIYLENSIPFMLKEKIMARINLEIEIAYARGYRRAIEDVTVLGTGKANRLDCDNEALKQETK